MHNGITEGTGSANMDLDNMIYKWVQDQGYRTGHVGKFLNLYDTGIIPAPVGIDWWRQFPENGAYVNYEFEMCNGGSTVTISGIEQCEYIRDSFTQFINDGPEPWFITLCPTEPHTPFCADMENIDSFAHSEYLFEPVYETDVSDKPSWIQAQANITEDEKRLLAHYARLQMMELAKVSRMIDGIMDVIDLNETIIIVSADNGLIYGEHRIFGSGVSKNDLYDSSARVPLCIAGPGVDRGIAGEGIPLGTWPYLVLVAQDISRTVLDATGAVHGLPPNITDGTGLLAPSDTRLVALFRRGGGGGGINPNPYTGWCLVDDAGVKLMRWEKVEPTDPDLLATDVYEMYFNGEGDDVDEHVNLAYLGGAYLDIRDFMENNLDNWIANPD